MTKSKPSTKSSYLSIQLTHIWTLLPNLWNNWRFSHSVLYKGQPW